MLQLWKIGHDFRQCPIDRAFMALPSGKDESKSNKWIVDSGSSIHLNGNLEDLFDVQEAEEVELLETIDGNEARIMM